jgi:hypothetical protein
MPAKSESRKPSVRSGTLVSVGGCVFVASGEMDCGLLFRAAAAFTPTSVKDSANARDQNFMLLGYAMLLRTVPSVIDRMILFRLRIVLSQARAF